MLVRKCVVVYMLSLVLPCALGLQCYQCQGIGGECQVSADPGVETVCPSIFSLMEGSVKTSFDYRWAALPVQKTRNDMIGLLTNIFNDSLPQSMFAEDLVNNTNYIYANTTSLDILEMVFSMVRGMTSQEADNACLYSSKTGGDNIKDYFRKCVYTKPMALSDWAWVQPNISRQARGKTESCGSGCRKKFCGEELCNDDNLFRCHVCMGSSYLCAEDEIGVSRACPADHSFCIKELSGDSSNRKLSARYCGTSYDADSVCGNEGKRIGIAAKGEVVCCNNRELENCNSASSLKFSLVIVSVVIMTFILSLQSMETIDL